MWGTRPTRWTCPTCKRRDGGWDETRTARPSTPSPRFPCKLPPLTGTASTVSSVSVRPLHCRYHTDFSFLSLFRNQSENLTRKDSLWTTSSATSPWKLAHIHTALQHLEPEGQMPPPRWCDHFIHLLCHSYTCIYGGCCQTHNIHIVPMPLSATEQKEMPTKRQVTEGSSLCCWTDKAPHPVNGSHKTVERPFRLSQSWHLEGQRLFRRTGASHPELQERSLLQQSRTNNILLTWNSSFHHDSLFFFTFSLFMDQESPEKRTFLVIFFFSHCTTRQDGGDTALWAMLTTELLVHLTFLFDLWCTFFEVILCFVLFFLWKNPVRVKLQWSLRYICSSFVFLSWPVGRAHAARLSTAAAIIRAPRQIKDHAAVFDEVNLKSVDMLYSKHSVRVESGSRG